MRSLICFFGLLASATTAIAQPPAEVLQKIQSTYSPSVTATVKSASNFLSLCDKNEVELTALDPISQSPALIHIKTYSQRFHNPSDMKTVILMPPTRGVNPIDRGYADALCVEGFRVAIVEHWDSDSLNTLDMDSIDLSSIRMLAAVRHVVEYLNPVRSGQVGILGTSVGAIAATLVLGYEPRIGTGALILGGGNVAEILATTNEYNLSLLREQRMKAFGLATVDDYRAALQEHIKIEPMDFIGYSGPKKVWMMVGTDDHEVPTKNQWDLYHAFGDQDLASRNADHFENIVYTYGFQQINIINFLKANLH